MANTIARSEGAGGGSFDFIKILLRGTGQVMFQNSAWTGLLFMVGIFWGAYAEGQGLVAWGALLGVIVSTVTGYILGFPARDGEQGLWGFNGVLVGCAFPTFMGNTVWMWLALVLCAALTTWVRTGFNNVMAPWKVNSFTFPFVFCTWMFLLAVIPIPASIFLWFTEKDVGHRTLKRLVQQRIGETHFAAAVFTNLTQDHLDYHGTMENYYQAKKLLFSRCDTAVIDTDDDYGKRLYSEVTCPKIAYGSSNQADFYADAIKLRADGTSFWLCCGGKSYPVDLHLTGMFNVSNALAAVAACCAVGMSVDDVRKALETCTGVRGRCEVIPTGRDFTVICDYAHTPDAVENILRSVKEYTKGRLICLFGCGGNRDATKRPKMAKAAAKYADFLVVTSDNPRDEEPEAIIADILAGLTDSDVPYEVVTDRKEAILRSMQLAQPEDVIVLAGKGHEDYQVLKGGVHIHMDEREIVRECLPLVPKR